MKVGDRTLASELASFFVVWEIKFKFEYVVTKPDTAEGWPTSGNYNLDSNGYEQFEVQEDLYSLDQMLKLLNTEFAFSVGGVLYSAKELRPDHHETWDGEKFSFNGDGKSFWLIEREGVLV